MKFAIWLRQSLGMTEFNNCLLDRSSIQETYYYTLSMSAAEIV